MSKEDEIKELKSEIELMKKVIIALARITVTAGFNCSYPEKDKFYDLVSKMLKESEQKMILKGIEFVLGMYIGIQLIIGLTKLIEKIIGEDQNK